jgi:hypothetical protein
MKNKTQILEIPRKDTFGGEDYKNWKLYSVDFYPFTDLEDYAQEINKIAELINNEDLLETLQKAKNFACSTIILNSKGKCQRVFFDSPEDLENFLINYKEQ